MKTVTIPWNDLGTSAATGRALEMSYWCKDQGLRRDTDYDWYFNQGFKETRFRFFGDAEQFSTMFALKWMGI